jgi:predicted RNA-binding protein with EMAP domain
MNATTLNQLKELAHELAYAHIQSSELWDTLQNAECDKEAEELAAAIERTIDAWFSRRLADKAEGERIEELITLSHFAQRTERRT